MNLALLAALLGLATGVVVSAVNLLYLVWTRPYRQAHSFLAIGFGYILLYGSYLGALLLVLRTCGYLHIASRSSDWYFALCGLALGAACGTFVAVRGETKWRKSGRFDDRSLLAKNRKHM
jgi:hypothetical protein